MPYIEENKIAQQSEKQVSLIPQRLVILNQQRYEFEALWKDLLTFSDRLKSIGCTIDSQNHPDNCPQVDSSKTISDQPVAPRQNRSGIIGELDNLIENNQSLLNEFNNKVWRELIKNAEYIERHI